MSWEKNRNNFWEWSKENQCVLQISMPHSGRTWLAMLMSDLTGKPVGNIDNFDYKSDCLYFMAHLDWDDCLPNKPKIISLIRDPRDVLLSMGYSHARNTKTAMSSNQLDLMFGSSLAWRCYFHGLIVQYENLCLFPQEVLRKILAYIGVEPVKSIEEVTHDKIPYNTGWERYFDNCLKWKSDEFFKHNDIIYDNLKQLMLKYGYTYSGHTINLLCSFFTDIII